MSRKTLARSPDARARAQAAERPAETRRRRWLREGVTTAVVLALVWVFLAGGIEQATFGLILGCACLAGAVWIAAVPVARESRSRRVALGVAGFALVWAASAIYPFWRLVRPGEPVAVVSLDVDDPQARAVEGLGGGVYAIRARTPAAGVPGQATYRVVFQDAGGREVGRLRGEFFRDVPQPGAAATVHNLNRHEVRLPAGEVRARIDKVDGSLAAPLELAVFAGHVPHHVMLGVEIAILLVALALDALFATRKRKSTLAVGALFTLVFLEAARASGLTPASMVRPLLGAAAVAVVVGAVGGYLLAGAARMAAGAVRRRLA